MLIQPSINFLVVEKDIATMQKCLALLSDEGHRVRTAESVEEALSIIQRHPADVDIMLLSLALPGRGGVTFIDALKRARSEILVIAMESGSGEETEQALDAGAYDSVPQDFTAAVFWAHMNRAIEVFRIRRQLGVLKRERKAALTEVKEQHNLLAILDSVTEGVVVTDWQTNVVFVNRKALLLFELTEPQVIGRPISAVVKSDDLLSLLIRALKADSSLVSLMAGQEPVVSVGEKILRVHVDPVKNSDGTVIGALALMHDVTKVSAMDNLRSDFLSMVSHELKAPLSALLMQISVVRDGLAGELTPKQQDLLGKAKEKTKGMITLVNDILDYRRIEEGKSIQKIEALDLGEILQRTVQLMRLSAEEKGIALESHVDQGLPPFSGDRGGMEAVFVNLISNAIKYTLRGGNVQVFLRSSGGEIRFKIIDNGLGIPAQDLDRIFDKFYRIKTEQTRGIGGSGLGLSIVKGIVNAHSGVIHVESEVGKGTTFIVSLPVVG